MNLAVTVVFAVIVPDVDDQLLNLYPDFGVAVEVFKFLVVVPLEIPFTVNTFELVVYVAPLITL